ncbi:hypothetical protein [Methanobacterium sp.]|jgi:hypothetical protein|uniref:hypothetical protein n=1 Tax=Methanobacterium sp. TaxID=2164 RepID=UPI0031592417
MALRTNKSIKGELENLGIGFDFESVRNLISDMQYLVDNGIYGNFFNVFKNWEDPVNVSAGMQNELQSISPLLTQAVSNGLTPEKSNIFSSYVDYYSFYHLYRFMEWVYSMNLGRGLQEEDVKAIFSSNIIEKIILGQENFEHVSPSTLNDSFFQDIKEVIWTDKHTEKFFDKLHDLLISKSFNQMEDREIAFKRELKRIAKFLTVCCTVGKGRRYITTIEVISSYKLLFKIIKMDIRHLVNTKEYKGLLICPVCNGYYYLQEDEIPDDFIQCSCGGNLVYSMSLENVKHYVGSFKEMVMDEKGLIAGAITSLMFGLIFNNVILIALLIGIVTIIMAKNYTDGFKYGFLTGNISGALFFMAVFISSIILSGVKFNQIPSIGGSTIFIFIMVVGVFAIYCRRIWTFMCQRSKKSAAD